MQKFVIFFFALIGECAVPAFWYMIIILLIIKVRFKGNGRDSMRKMKDIITQINDFIFSK